MMVTDPGGLTRIKELPEDILLNRVCGGDSSFGRAFGDGSVGVARRIVHRERTGNAEREWAVASGQWPVPAARFFAGQPRAAVATWVLVGIRCTGE